MATFAAILHDFGIATYTMHTWHHIPKAQWESILKDALDHDRRNGTNWWFPTLCDIRVRATNWTIRDNNPPLHKHYDIVKVPQWLLNHRKCTSYFGAIPGDMVRAVIAYLRRDTSGLFCAQHDNIKTTTSLCGFTHSFNDRPAVTVTRLYNRLGDKAGTMTYTPTENVCYTWYQFGEKRRSGGQLTGFELCFSREIAIWHDVNDSNKVSKAQVRIIPEAKYPYTKDSSTCIRGDGSTMDKQFDAYVAAIKQSQCCTISFN